MNEAEAFFTAQIYSAEQAHSLGFVQSVHGDVFAHVDQTAGLIASNAPLTIRAAKLAMIAMREPEQADLAGVDAAVADCFASQGLVLYTLRRLRPR